MASAILAPWLAPYPQDALGASHLDRRLIAPSEGLWLGTDHLGRDILSRVLFGGRVSLSIGFASMLLSAVVGTIAGLVSGYSARWLDELIMRSADVFLGIPSLILAMLVVLVLGPADEMVVLAIGVTTWPRYARLVRAEAMRIKVVGFVEAALSYGASARLIVTRHIFPGTLPVLMAQAALLTGQAILVAAALGFIGLGARPPSAEWGLNVAIGREYLPEAWWVAFFPGGMILLTVTALNVLGDAIRVALDPRTD